MKKIFLYLLMIIIILFVSSQKPVPVKEGYESLTTCMTQGYPREFCLNVPVQASLDKRCRCATGEFGNYQTSSTCDCDPFNSINYSYPNTSLPMTS